MTSPSELKVEKAKNGKHGQKLSRFERWLPTAVVAAVIGAVVVMALTLYLGQDWPTRGQIGDSFGPFTSVLTLATLLWTVRSFLMQGRELQLQRDELASQREEQEKQTDALAKQTDALTRLDNTLNVMRISKHL